MNHSLRGPLARALLTVAVAAVAGVAATPAGAAGSGRAYELMTPTGASEGDAIATQLSPDGERLVFNSHEGLYGARDGYWNGFAAARGEGGWSGRLLTDTPDFPPFGVGAAVANYVFGASPDGATAFVSTLVRLVPEDVNSEPDIYALGPDGEPTLLTHDPDGAATGATDLQQGFPLGGLVTFIGPARSAPRVVLQASRWLTQDASRTPFANNVYTLDADGTVQLVGAEAVFGGMSDDGETIAYTPALDAAAMLWRDGEPTPIAMSESQDPGNPGVAGADIGAVSTDGAKAWFTTRSSSPLLPGDPRFLSVYEYDVASGDLARVSAGAPGHPTTSDSAVFVAASADGSHVFFASSDQLTDDAPADSATKIYVRAAGTTTYVGSVGGEQLSGKDPGAPFAAQLRVSDDGRSAVFTSPDALTPADDDGGSQDVYLWREGAGLTLLSPARAGAAAGEATLGTWAEISSSYPVRNGGPDGRGVWGRAISGDGSWVAFTTPEALTPDAADNSALKIYAWHDGTLSLVSPAGSARSAFFLDMSESGRDIVFSTGQALVEEDADGSWLDVYDARLGGGFAKPPTPPQPCPQNSCDGPVPPGTTPPSSETFDGPGDAPLGPDPSSSFTAKVRGTKLTVAVRNGGRLTAVGTARVRERVRTRVGGRLRTRTRTRVVTVVRVSRTLRAAGSETLALRLGRRGRTLAARARGKRLRVRLRVTFEAPGSPDITRALNVTFRGGSTEVKR